MATFGLKFTASKIWKPYSLDKSEISLPLRWQNEHVGRAIDEKKLLDGTGSMEGDMDACSNVANTLNGMANSSGKTRCAFTMTMNSMRGGVAYKVSEVPFSERRLYYVKLSF